MTRASTLARSIAPEMSRLAPPLKTDDDNSEYQILVNVGIVTNPCLLTSNNSSVEAGAFNRTNDINSLIVMIMARTIKIYAKLINLRLRVKGLGL